MKKEQEPIKPKEDPHKHWEHYFDLFNGGHHGPFSLPKEIQPALNCLIFDRKLKIDDDGKYYIPKPASTEIPGFDIP